MHPATKAPGKAVRLWKKVCFARRRNHWLAELSCEKRCIESFDMKQNILVTFEYIHDSSAKNVMEPLWEKALLLNCRAQSAKNGQLAKRIFRKHALSSSEVPANKEENDFDDILKEDRAVRNADIHCFKIQFSTAMLLSVIFAKYV